MKKMKNNLISIGLSLILMLVLIGIGFRLLLSQVLLNETFYFKLQERLEVANSLQLQVTDHLKELMIANNLPAKLVENLIPIEDVEQIIKQQTIETIAFLKQEQDTITVMNPEPYVWELEPRIVTYLNESGYQLEQNGYEDLSQINASLYSLTRGVLQLFDVNRLAYSSTVQELITYMDILMGPWIILVAIIMSALLVFVWRERLSHFLYWMGVSMLSASLFLVALTQNRERAVHIMVNETINQAISDIINQSLQFLHSGAIIVICFSVSLIFLLIFIESYRIKEKNLK